MKTLRAFLLMLTLLTPVVLHAEAPAVSEAGALPAVQTYDELRQAISKARGESRVRVEKAVEAERVREAWEIGRLIDAHVLQHKERADYDQQVIAKLAADLGMSDTELYSMLKFARVYPISKPAWKLSWSHYVELLKVKNDKDRQALAESAEKEGWSREQLRKEVQALKKGHREKENPRELLPVPYSGNPGTYKIIRAPRGPFAGELALDLGFSNYFRLTEVVKDTTPFAEEEVVSFMNGDGEVHSLGAFEGMQEKSPLFTYRAWVHRVLDGDTIEAVVDLGFGVVTTQTLRLRGIDAPELATREGVEAKEFVEAALANFMKAERPILIKTSKSDKYDRYLADVFIPEKNGEEKYLNNLLLKKKYAVRVHE